MIFVTVGTDQHDFSRLLKKVDKLAEEVEGKMVVQRGTSNYRPENCDSFDFLPHEEFVDYIEKSDLVITHAGVGTIIECLKRNKKTILVPRREKYREHTNDHQLDITEKMEKQGRALACYNLENLKEKIREATKFEISPGEREKIEKVLDKFVKKVSRGEV